jgi:hypothetical protein
VDLPGFPRTAGQPTHTEIPGCWGFTGWRELDGGSA